MRYARIVSTGRYVPEIEITNAELQKRFPQFPDFVEKMEAASGIGTRWYAKDSWATSDVALGACQEALERAGREPADVDLILLGTDSPDYITPATSVVLQEKLGAKNAGTFDIGCACASFPTGLATGASLISANPALKTVLVVGVYMMHKLADPNDPMVFFYGDGAGAAVLEPSDMPGFVNCAMQSDGAYSKYWGIFSGGTAEPATEESVKAGRTTVKMVQRYPPEINHEGWPRLIRRLAREGGYEISAIDQIIFTQVRKPSIELVMADLGLPMEKTHCVMDKWGYTGSACIPMAFDDAIEKGRIKKGDLVVFAGSGVGYNQAAAAFRFV